MTTEQLLSGKNFFLIAGPCVIESEQMAMTIAETALKATSALNIPYIFKGSFRKANRSKASSFTGIGDERALQILRHVGDRFCIPVLTDIHESKDAAVAAEFVDILQIPAFLCRQTELLVAAAQTGRMVNIKKGQFLSPEAMKFAAQKVVDSGNRQVMLTERGVTFGYNDLVVDFRSIPAMEATGFPVVMEVTHSLQKPNQASGVTAGTPQMAETIARAAIAVGTDGLFIETHPDPQNAMSDGDTQLQLDRLDPLLRRLVKIREAITD